MSELPKCPKCGSHGLRSRGPITRFACWSAEYDDDFIQRNTAFPKFDQTKDCQIKALENQLTDLQSKLDKAREALRQIASDKTEFCYHGRFAAKTLDEVK